MRTSLNPKHRSFSVFAPGTTDARARIHLWVAMPKWQVLPLHRSEPTSNFANKRMTYLHYSLPLTS